MTTLGTARRSGSPTGVRVAPKSYDELEVVAEGIRPLLPKAAGAGPWKLDALRIFEQTLPRAKFNYCVAETNGLKNIAGFTIPELRVVVVRQDVYDGLFEDRVFSRSTVIHELSHIVLDHATTFYRGRPTGQHQYFEDSEWQANSLTAAIMMPLDACRAAGSPQNLAAMCGTSVQASTFRLQKLIERGLLAKKQH